MKNKLSILDILGIWLVISLAGSAQAQLQQLPEIKAFLPAITEVRPSQPMVIDGLWKISSLNKMIRIDRGRAYAIDGWTHLFLLKIQPGMVVLQNLEETALGTYTGVDLPLSGPLEANLTGDRILDVTVAGKMGEAKYQLIPQDLDEPEAFKKAIKALRAAGR